MKLPGNGWTRVGVFISAGLLLFGGGSYWGWKAKVAREAVREERIDQHLVVADRAFPRLDAVERKADALEATAHANATAIGELKVEVSRLVDSQNKLTVTLMDYIARQPPRAAR